MICHYCDCRATHTMLVVDLDQQGVNLNERGYKRVPICVAHAIAARQHTGSRVEEIEGVVFYEEQA